MWKLVPLPDFAVHGDEAAGLLDDAVDGGQAQARALAHRLGGEEGIEDLALDLLGHADAGIGHFDADIVAGRHDRGAQRRRLGHRLVGGLDGDGAALRHGVAGIDHQIDDGVAKLRLVGMNRPEIVAALHIQADAFAHQPAQHLGQFADRVAQRQNACGCMVCLRLKARSWPTSVAARSAF